MGFEVGRPRTLKALLAGARADFRGLRGDQLGQTFIQPQRRAHGMAFVHQPMGQLVAQAEGELQRILPGMQRNFIARLRGERFGLEPRLGALVEGRGGQQADVQPGRFRRRADPLQSGFHGDRQNRGCDFGN